MTEIQDLEVLSIIGFEGTASNSLCLHPDEIHLLYPCGNAVTIFNRKTKEQHFLNGHTNLVSSVALSPSGKYVASGQINFMGFKAPIILWDFETRIKLSQYEIHKVRVEHLTFSCNDAYIISLGGRDDTCVVVYDVTNREPICGGYASGSNTGNASTVAALNKRPNFFLTGGDRTLRLWCLDVIRRKISFNEVACNKTKRVITTIVVDGNDELAYCGTTSGDIIKASLGLSADLDNNEQIRMPSAIGIFGKPVSQTKRNSTCQVQCYSKGVTCIKILKKGELLLGTGDGVIELVKERTSPLTAKEVNCIMRGPTVPMLIPMMSHHVDAGVSSIRLTKSEILIGNIQSELFQINRKTWKLSLLSTCHKFPIYDIAFPSDLSQVFATSSEDNVRLWKTETCQELLRIQVANMSCSQVIFQHDGQVIITSWNDGKIRAFTPVTGQLIYTIENAHTKGVTAIALTKNGKTLISGGGEGQVRMWDIKTDVQNLKAVLQDHKGPVSDIAINHASDEAASASSDGSCIIWDIVRCKRKNIIFANTLFMSVTYHPTDCQILTTGTDKKISYWETFDGSLIREVEGSSGAINTTDISPCGAYFLTAGNDQMLKVWKYEEAEVTHVGLGHASIITKARFSPDSKFIISVSTDGAIFRWRNPYYQ